MNKFCNKLEQVPKSQLISKFFMDEKGKVSVNWRHKDTDLDLIKMAGLPKHENFF